MLTILRTVRMQCRYIAATTKTGQAHPQQVNHCRDSHVMPSSTLYSNFNCTSNMHIQYHIIYTGTRIARQTDSNTLC